MLDLYNKIKKLSKSYNITEEDRDEVVQLASLYCFRNNITELPDSYIRKLIITWILQLKRTKTETSTVLTETGFIDIEGTSFQQMESSVFKRQVLDKVLRIKTIPLKYRQAFAEYITSNESMETVAKQLNLNIRVFREYFRKFKPVIRKVLS